MDSENQVDMYKVVKYTSPDSSEFDRFIDSNGKLLESKYMDLIHFTHLNTSCSSFHSMRTLFKMVPSLVTRPTNAINFEKVVEADDDLRSIFDSAFGESTGDIAKDKELRLQAFMVLLTGFTGLGSKLASSGGAFTVNSFLDDYFAVCSESLGREYLSILYNTILYDLHPYLISFALIATNAFVGKFPIAIDAWNWMVFINDCCDEYNCGESSDMFNVIPIKESEVYYIDRYGSSGDKFKLLKEYGRFKLDVVSVREDSEIDELRREFGYVVLSVVNTKRWVHSLSRQTRLN